MKSIVKKNKIEITPTYTVSINDYGFFFADCILYELNIKKDCIDYPVLKNILKYIYDADLEHKTLVHINELIIACKIDSKERLLLLIKNYEKVFFEVYIEDILCIDDQSCILTEISPLVFIDHKYIGLRSKVTLEKKILEVLYPSYFNNPCFLSDEYRSDTKEVDTSDGWDYEQKKAILLINNKQVSFITGGAGTGKTSLLCEALAILFKGGLIGEIACVAPTGKAVKRMRESVKRQYKRYSKEIQDLFDNIEFKTIHQLLAYGRDGVSPRKNNEEPILYDLIVFDECSMLTNSLFANVIDAIITKTKLVLLGDDKQLPPVDSNSFFNTFCRIQKELPYEKRSPIFSCLKKSFRFEENSIVFNCAKATQIGDLEGVKRSLGNNLILNESNFLKVLLSFYDFSFTSIEKKVKEQIILCITNKGTFGTEAVNSFFDKRARSALNVVETEKWYVAKPIIIKENDYVLGLFNGDIGFCVLEDDGYYIDFGDKKISTSIIADNYDLAFAITVHKSQGSEYDTVHFMLEDSNVLSKELIYTAITRAKKNIIIYGKEDILKKSLEECKEEPLSFFRYYLERSNQGINSTTT